MPGPDLPGPSALGRLGRIIGFSVLTIAVVLAGIRLFFPSWWAVPGLLLTTVSQPVPREVTIVNPGGVPTPPGAVTTPVVVASQPGSAVGGPLLPPGRFTVLLLGSDNDKKFTANAVLTQSMILVNVDPASHQVAMVSIPRDFWVPIPTYGDQKIDVAYEVGGISLARTTVEQLFGVHVDYYAWVGLSGLVKMIDSLGGIDVTVLHPVLDEMYPDDLTGPDPYAYFRLYIPAGPQHLDGTTALEYVRSRHGDLQSDFGRSARQQQVLLAIKSLATDPSMIGHIPDLASSLADAVKTDFSLPQALQLANLARGISPSQIHQQILSAPDFAQLGNSPDGQEQIVIPDWPSIHLAMAPLFNLHPTSVSDTLAQQAWQEKATIQVLNGDGEANLANQAMDYLRWQGLSVDSTGNAARFDYTHSQILVRDRTKSATAQMLATVLNATVAANPDPTLASDLVVIIGQDHPPFPTMYNDGAAFGAATPVPAAAYAFSAPASTSSLASARLTSTATATAATVRPTETMTKVPVPSPRPTSIATEGVGAAPLPRLTPTSRPPPVRRSFSPTRSPGVGQQSG